MIFNAVLILFIYPSKIPIYALIFILWYYYFGPELHIYRESDVDPIRLVAQVMGNRFYANTISKILFSGLILLLTVQGIMIIRKALAKQRLEEKEFPDSNLDTKWLQEKALPETFVPRYGDHPDFVKGKDNLLLMKNVGRTYVC